jgi:transcriptional regulator with XRE-family HTH domain
MKNKRASKEPRKTNDLVENVGEVIRNVREQKRLSQKEVAAAIDVDPTQYNRIELGKSLPTLKTIAKIAKALNVSVDSLISSEQGTIDVEIKDKSLFYKVKLIDSLSEEEKNTVLKVIDLALSKKKFKDLLQQVT